VSPAVERGRAGLSHQGVLVVACGNALRGDDAAGPEVGELLVAELAGTGAVVIVADQLLPELAHDASRSRRVVFIDAAADRPAGSISVEPVTPRQPAPGDAGGAGPASGDPARGARALEPFSHGMGPADVLTLARDLYSATPDAVLVSVGAQSFEPGAELSDVVRRAIPRAARAALRAIEEGAGTVSAAHA
jgi:Ni,Fe-hydrogenase maturation factor